MLTYVLLKPESSHMLRDVKSVVSQASGESKLCKLIDEGLDSLMGKEAAHLSPEVVHVESGITTKATLAALYPNLREDKMAIARNTLLDKPYNLIVIDSPEVDYAEIQELKGKIYSPNTPEGTGLRGLIKRQHKLLGDGGRGSIYHEGAGHLAIGQNFIHIPDNENEAMILVNYLKHTSTSSRESIALHSRFRELLSVSPKEGLA